MCDAESGCRRLVTVDWDTDKLWRPIVCYYRLKSLCSRPNVECEVYKTRHGYHIYVKLPKPISLWSRLMLRSYLCDDPDRYLIDLRKAEIGFFGPVGTLFQATNKGKIYVEKRIDIEQLGIDLAETII